MDKTLTLMTRLDEESEGQAVNEDMEVGGEDKAESQATDKPEGTAKK